MHIIHHNIEYVYKYKVKKKKYIADNGLAWKSAI